ncbi:hypothetical protein RchiOBHm_Chr3g0476991 [Rosa chinensis]|uniref:Uncharacterized protein n=1 Tax=Rosa chinensis TaxID=74649 RepID=A0A2P6RCU5_ROSCH|nr:hypothetical protein RchiOBHm_Chr3g0476991 [Rosa chinensis]
MAMPWNMTLWMAEMVWLDLTGWVSSCLTVADELATSLRTGDIGPFDNCKAIGMRGLSTKLQSLCWSSTSKTLHFRFSKFHKIDNTATLAKLSKPNKAHLKQQQEESSSFGSLFSEITEILGAEHVTLDKTPSGFFISKETHLGVGEVGEENAKVNALGEKEDIAVVEETRFESVAETDVSPVVCEVTKIVRAENGLVSMEETVRRVGFSIRFRDC